MNVEWSTLHYVSLIITSSYGAQAKSTVQMTAAVARTNEAEGYRLEALPPDWDSSSSSFSGVRSEPV